MSDKRGVEMVDEFIVYIMRHLRNFSTLLFLYRTYFVYLRRYSQQTMVQPYE